jgi:hypothetical protein
MSTFTAVGEVQTVITLGLSHPEDGSTAFLQNVSNYLPLFADSV